MLGSLKKTLETILVVDDNKEVLDMVVRIRPVNPSSAVEIWVVGNVELRGKAEHIAAFLDSRAHIFLGCHTRC